MCGGSRDKERKDAKGDASFYRVRFAWPPGLSSTTIKWAVTTPSTGLRVIRPGKEGGGDGCCLRTDQAQRRAEFSNVLPAAKCRCGGGSGGGDSGSGGVTYARVVAADNDDTQQWLLRVHTYIHIHIHIHLYIYTCARMYTVYIMYKTESLLENS